MSLEELRQCIATIQPAYTRDYDCVVIFRAALVYLSVGEALVVSSAKEGDVWILASWSPFRALQHRG
jgi:hypothetical protein